MGNWCSSCKLEKKYVDLDKFSCGHQTCKMCMNKKIQSRGQNKFIYCDNCSKVIIYVQQQRKSKISQPTVIYKTDYAAINYWKQKQKKKREQLYHLKVTHQQQKKQMEKTTSLQNMSKTLDKLHDKYAIKHVPLKKEIQQQQNGQLNVTIIGQISAGKSTIWNWVFNDLIQKNLVKAQQSGVGQTTEGISLVFDDQKNRIRYFDCFGFSEAVNVTNVSDQVLHINRAFIVSALSLKNCHRAIQILNHWIPNKVYFVITKCDLYPEQQLVNQQKKNQNYLFQTFKIKAQILLISAIKGDDYKDNLKFKTMMRNIK